MPIGHMEGNYFCDDATLQTLKAQDRIAFRYATHPERSMHRPIRTIARKTSPVCSTKS